MATLEDLQTKYSLEDAHLLNEILNLKEEEEYLYRKSQMEQR